MQTYDSYKNRIRKIAAIKNLIVRFRVLIIIVSSVILALLSAFLISKGSITTNVELSAETIYYGDNYTTTEAKALFSGVKYEYSVAGSNEWTSERPTAAGKYLVRAVTNGGFGKRYGSPVAFEILPKSTELKILDTSVVYGNNPKNIQIELVGGDKLITGDLDFDFASFATENTTVEVNPASVRIENQAGNDVTASYDIAFNSADITLLDKRMTVKPYDFTKVFDNVAVNYEKDKVDDATLEALNGDIITFDYEISGDTALYAGRYSVSVKPDSVKIMHGAEDVTERYDLSFKNALITIEKKKITVTTASLEHEYDGKEHGNKNITADGLVIGHTVEITDELEITRTDVGNSQNRYGYTIKDSGGFDRTDNYDITVNYGEIKITPRHIDVRTADASKPYDGMPLFKTDGFTYDSSRLVDGHTLVPDDSRSVSSATNVSDSGENVLYFVVKDGTDNVSGNYEIAVTYGTLTISKRNLVITTANANKEYDGQPLSKTDGITTVGLASGQRVEVDLTQKYASVTDAGSSDNSMSFVIYDAYGSTVDKNNYNIATTFGTLTVTKRNIKITVDSYTRPYDGTPLVLKTAKADHVSENGAFLGNDGLISGHRLQASVTEISVTKVGSVTNIYDYEVMAGDNSVMDNYNIVGAIVSGTLEIIKRDVTIYTKDGRFSYTGKPQAETAPDSENLPSGHSANAIESTITYITEYRENGKLNETEFEIFHNGENVTDQFNLTLRKVGRLYINQKPITVTTGSYDGVYDGKWHYNDTASSQDLVSGHVIVVKTGITSDKELVPKRKDVGSTPNELQFSIYDTENGQPKNLVTDNYIISVVYGDITVTQKEITVTTAGVSVTYDGKPHGNKSIASHDDLAEGHSIFIAQTEVLTRTDKGTEDNIYSFIIRDENGYDVTYNYDITSVYGKIDISARAITVKTGSYNEIYDGIDHSIGIIDSENIDLAENHQISAISLKSVNPVITDEENSADFIIRDKDGNDVTSNYDITPDFGTLTVRKRPITVTTNTYNEVYDGMEHLGFIENIPSINLAPNQSICATEIASVKDVVTGKENKAVFRIDDISSNDVTSNYDITPVFGTLTVTERPLKITTLSYNELYDGQDHVLDNFGQDNLVAGHNINVTKEFTSFRDAVDNAENYAEFEIADENGNPVTSNYHISYDFGKITIRKRVITIKTTDEIFTYNDQDQFALGYSVSGDGLAAGQRCTTASGKYATVKYVSDTKPENNVISYRILDKDGVDVADLDYEIHYEYGTLTVQQRDIDIYFDSYDEEYDGLEHKGGIEDVENLVVGHKVAATGLPSVKEAGDYETNTTADENITVSDANGKDVTANYFFICHNGELNVKQRTIVISTGSYNGVYDGKSHKAEQITDNGKLVEGHTIVGGEFKSVKDVCSGVINSTDFTIYDENDVDVTVNYDITPDFGTLTVSQRKTTVTTGTYNEEYDGKEHSADSQTNADNLAENHKLVVTSDYIKVCEPTASPVDNVITYEIHDENGENVTANYDIDDNFGTLNVTKRAIAISTDSYNEVYDGVEHDLRHYTDDNGKLIEGQEIVATWTVDRTVKDVMTDTPNEVAIRIFDGETEVTGYYDIVYKFGNIAITPKSITVTPFEYIAVYDGQSHDVDSYTQEGLLSIHTLSVMHDIESVCDVIDTFNTVNIDIFDGDGVSVKSNYDVDVTESVLRITQKDITVTTAEYIGEYDGKEHKVDTFTQSGLIEELHELKIVYDRTSVCGVIDTANKATIDIVIKGTENSVLKNYNLTPVFGMLRVTAKSVTITTDSYDKEYDGLEHSEEYLDKSELCEGHEWQISGEFKSVRDYTPTPETNSVAYAIVDAEGNNVTGNYDITEDFGTLNVRKRIVEVTIGSYEGEYDGQKHEIDVTFDDSRFVLNHKLDYSLDYEEVCDVIVVDADGNAVTVDNNFGWSVKTDDAASTDVSVNYDIQYNRDATVLITPRRVKITTKGDTKPYDGTPLSNGGYRIVHLDADGVEDGEFAVAEKDNIKLVGELFSITDVGEEYNDNRYEINDGVHLNNYSITYDETNPSSKLIITPGQVTVTSKSYTGEFDGQWHDIGIEYDNGALADGHTISVVHWDIVDGDKEGHQVRNVIERTKNYFECVIVDKDGKPVDEHNYNVTPIYGWVEITAIRLEVATPDGKWKYNGGANSNTEPILGSRKPLDGHILVAEEGYATITHVGTTPNEITYSVKSKSNAESEVYDVNETSNYIIDYVKTGTLSVTARIITVTTQSDEFVFDGQPHHTEKAPIVGGDGLAPNQELSVIKHAEATYYSENGVTNDTTYAIYDNDKKDVSKTDYDIEWKYDGTIKILQREIDITVADGYKIYDAQKLVNKSATAKHNGEEGLVLEHELKILDEEISILNVWESGTGINNYKNFDIVDKQKNSVMSNYKIVSITPGDLTIDPKPLTIASGTYNEEYDGESHCELSKTVTTFALSTHELVRDESTVKYVTEPATIPNDIRYTKIIDADGNDITRNYAISYKDGKLIVRKRRITVKTGTATQIYNAKPLSKHDGWEITAGSLVEHDAVVRDESSDTEITNVGSVPNVLSFVIKNSDGNGADVTHCYQIVETQFGTLTVTAREITITTAGDSRPYNGQPLTKREEGDYSAENLVDDGTHIHKSVLDTSKELQFGTITNIGSTPNVLYFIIEDEEGNDVTDNYSIIREDFGTLTVTKRTVYVKPITQEHIYDGKEFVYENAADNYEYFGLAVENSENNIAVGEKLKIAVRFIDKDGREVTPVTVGKYTIEIVLSGCAIVKGRYTYNYNENSNYEIIIDTAELEIQKRNIEIALSDREEVYSGKTITSTGYTHKLNGSTEENNGFVGKDSEGVSVSFTFYSGTDEAEPVNAGSYGIEAVFEYSDYIKENYEIVGEQTTATLTIKRYEIEIKPHGGDKTYDGQYYEFDGKYDYLSDAKVLKGDELDLKATFSGTVNGKYLSNLDKVSEAATYTITFDREYVTNNNPNYKIVTSSGTYTIKQVEITVGNASFTEVYNGSAIESPHEMADMTISQADLDLILSLNHEVVADGTIFSVTDAGTYKNEQTVKIVEKDSRNDVTYNYKITLDKGTIVINKRTLKITTTFDEDKTQKTYDGNAFEITLDDFIPDGLVDYNGNRHYVYSAEWTSIINAGHYTDYEITSIVIYNQADSVKVDLSENYNIVYEDGARQELIVNPQHIKFTLPDKITKMYSGEVVEFEVGDITLEYGNPDTVGFKKYSVFDAETNTASTLRNAGTYRVSVDTADIILDGVENNGNYAIDNDEVSLSAIVEITPYTVAEFNGVVSTNNETRAFNGQKLIGKSISYTDDNGGLRSGDTIEITTPANDRPFALNPKDDVENVLSFRIMHGNEDVTDSYDFTDCFLDYGRLKITSEILLVINEKFDYDAEDHLQTEGKVHDVHSGQEKEIAGFTFKANAVAYKIEGDTYSDPLTEIVDAGTYLIVYTNIELRINGEIIADDVFEKFEIQNGNEFGGYTCNVEIARLEIFVKPIDKIKVLYNGENIIAHGEDEWDYVTNENDAMVGEQFVAGHIFKIISTSDALNIERNTSKSGITITSGVVLDFNTDPINGVPVTDNYLLRFVYDEGTMSSIDGLKAKNFTGKITLEKRAINVEPIYQGEHFIYNGEKHEIAYSGDGEELFKYDDTIEAENYGLLDGHKIVVSKAEATATPGEKRSSAWLKVKIVDSDGVDVSKGYQIKYNRGEYSSVFVDKLAITIESASAEKVYDGTPLEAKEFTVTMHTAEGDVMLTESGSALMSNHFIDVNVVGKINRVGYTENEFEILIYKLNSKGEKVEVRYTDFYDVNIVYGRLEIK